MSNNVLDLLKELGYNPTKERQFYIDTLAHIAAELLEYRKVHRLSQKQLAEKLGVTQAMISKIESGNANLSIKKLSEIAAKLDGYLYVTLNLVSDEEEIDTENEFKHENKEETTYENEYPKELCSTAL